MSAIDLCLFLTSYTLVVAVVATAELLRSRRAASLVSVMVALAAIVATTMVGFYLKPGTNYVSLLGFLVRELDFSAMASMGLGIAAALVWVTRLSDPTPTGSTPSAPGAIQRVVAQLILAASIVGVVTCSLAFIWKELRGGQRDPAARMLAPGFMIEKIADLDYAPIRVAVSESGQVYVCYDYFENAGTMGGGIVELTRDAATGKYRKRIVADSPLLMRCYGLVARDGELFVSRSGISATATRGTIAYQDTGAVTRLRDVDGDGYFEFADDIVTGLPGARGPDTMQQNNGICFAADGTLFVTTASAANRALTGHPWEGAVLRVDSNLAEPEVIARGFRNPFGIVIGPDDELFVTDNDIDENPGDELNHIVRGAHYGHPYVVPNEPTAESSGFREPILVGEHEWNFLGITYATSQSLPDEYRDCLYVADFMQHAIWRIKLERIGDTYKVSSVDKYASVSSPIDIAVTDSGEFFVISRNTKNLYRIRPLDPVSGRSDG